MTVLLPFEKKIFEIEKKIDELTKLTLDSDFDSSEIEKLKKQAQEFKQEVYDNLKPLDKLQIARHPNRPNFFDYAELITDNFMEMHGDREGADDRAIIGGIAQIDGKSVVLVGTHKGKTTKENLECNFGMPQPQGYRKALRLFYHAQKFNLPIVVLIDTPGAFPGIKAEETGQGGAIATNLKEMAKLTVPVIAVITGEGCSGGALGIGVANRVLMLEHAYYTVISPEGCASILWRDAKYADKAAEALKITADDLLKFKIIDEKINETQGGAHNNAQETAENIKKSVVKYIKELSKMSAQELKDDRYDKFRKMGEFAQ